MYEIHTNSHKIDETLFEEKQKVIKQMKTT